jgi:tRNA-2-methylthio-N6-dimethylallyladenosine synthase
LRVYLETYGCQMNEYDSKAICSVLVAEGHSITSAPTDADVIIVNTCSVRERAERRVLGRLRHLRGMIGPRAVLGVIGCVAQRLGDRLTRAVLGLDFVVGTDQYPRLLEVIESARSGSRMVLVSETPEGGCGAGREPIEAAVSDFVSVMRGCDNFCAYCIVPYVRGRERSRPLEAIVDEVSALVKLGMRDVTLIGQNVNSYRDNDTDFAGLLQRVNAVPDLSRIRFATSHPKDLTPRLIEAVAELDKVCEHVHLPVQSGSDAVLRAMNRSYTREQYLDLVEHIRRAIPDVAITTDVIVGYPTETPAQFEETVSLMREVRFDSAFMFRYSVRDGTLAASLPDDVPEREKLERLATVISLQKAVTEERNRSLVGSTQAVLAESSSERDASLLFGRTRTAKPVVFPGSAESIGSVLPISISRVSAWTLHGRPPIGRKADAGRSDAAGP